MTEIAYDDVPVPVRGDLIAAHQRAWARLAGPGTWFTGEKRIAIAAETRNAPGCALCAARKEALSPYGIEGKHDQIGGLDEATVDVIHRIVSDPARLMKKWVDGLIADGMENTEYVETVGTVCTTISLDTFARAIGIPPRALPAPIAGEPSRVRPASASQGPAWVPWIAAEDATGDELDLFGPDFSNVQRAMSLVPDESRGFFDLVTTQYLPRAEMRNFGEEFRAITHAQIELLAGRISAINQCVY